MNYTTTLTDTDIRYYSNLKHNNWCYKKMAERSKREQAKQKILRERRLAVIKFVFVVLALLIGGKLFIDNIELFSYTQRKALMHEVMAGNEDSIEIFEKYIDRDIYLFDGPITINAMAEKYDMDADELRTMYYNSGYETLQEFFNKVVKPVVK